MTHGVVETYGAARAVSLCSAFADDGTVNLQRQYDVEAGERQQFRVGMVECAGAALRR